MLALALLAARAAPAQVPHGLGSVHFTVSCTGAAQVQFDRAVALLHHMTYPEARRAFEQVARTDPRAEALGAPSELERRFLAAAGAFFAQPESTDYWARIRRWERAMDHLAAAPPGEGARRHADRHMPTLEYLAYAYLQQGADREAGSAVERLRGTAPLEPTFKTAFHLASTRARARLARTFYAELLAIAAESERPGVAEAREQP
jgi:hypothetical protein